MMALHAALLPLEFLVGRWSGEGQGLWEADSPFRYREEVAITHDGRPFLAYHQHTWAVAGGAPRHTEMGFVRLIDGASVELVVVQGIGLAEVSVGTLEDGRCTLSSVSMGLTPSAKPVTAVVRRFWLDDRGRLRYHVRMGMNGEPPADHLDGVLERQTG